MKSEGSGFHLVCPSPWPLVLSSGVLLTGSGIVMSLHGYGHGGIVLSGGVGCTVGALSLWLRDVIRESTLEGQHTVIVQKGLKLGVLLFIVSESMFFVGFFIAYMWASFGVSLELGAVWPPLGVVRVSYSEIPLWNTVILLGSGASVTWAHHAMIVGRRFESLYGMWVTVGLALLFSCFQYYEYRVSGLCMSDGAFGGSFFMLTGFHGFHVLIGTLMIGVACGRLWKYELTREHHVGFEAAAFYWHFVDVVWLLLFIVVYVWGN